MSAKPTPQPLSDRATGEWFQTPAGLMQRYDPAPGGGHWYFNNTKAGDGIWHVFLESHVKPPKRRRKAKA